MDLTPRTGPDAAVASAARTRAPSTRGRKIGVSVVLALVLAAGAIILFQGLSNATMYFYNADEAVAKRASLEDKRFRLQGEVVPGTIREEGELVVFDVRFNGVTVAVQNDGQPARPLPGGDPGRARRPLGGRDVRERPDPREAQLRVQGGEPRSGARRCALVAHERGSRDSRRRARPRGCGRRRDHDRRRPRDGSTLRCCARRGCTSACSGPAPCSRSSRWSAR